MSIQKKKRSSQAANVEKHNSSMEDRIRTDRKKSGRRKEIKYLKVRTCLSIFHMFILEMETVKGFILIPANI